MHNGLVISWSNFAGVAPDLAAAIQRRMVESRYSLLGTLRADGFPRISGVVASFSGGELWLALRPDSTMAADLLRDPRFSLHSGPTDQPEPQSDTKLHGRAIEVTDHVIRDRFVESLPHGPPSSGVALFGVDLIDASMVRLSEERTHHLIDSWRAGEAAVQHQRV